MSMTMNEFAKRLNTLEKIAKAIFPDAAETPKVMAGPDGLHSVVALTCGLNVWMARAPTQREALDLLQADLQADLVYDCDEGSGIRRITLPREPKSLDEVIAMCAAFVLVELDGYMRAFEHRTRLPGMINYAKRVLAQPRTGERPPYEVLCVSGWVDWGGNCVEDDLERFALYLMHCQGLVIRPNIMVQDRIAVFNLMRPT